jgi:hypothetical protein
VDIKIHGTMTHSDRAQKHTFEGVTDNNEKLFFHFTLDKKISLGELKSEIKVKKNNNNPLSLSEAFSVI